jgi:DNA-directed RNA polymerase specialized sigma24 family protein
MEPEKVEQRHKASRAMVLYRATRAARMNIAAMASREGFTQAQIAEIMGVNPSTIERWLATAFRKAKP